MDNLQNGLLSSLIGLNDPLHVIFSSLHSFCSSPCSLSPFSSSSVGNLLIGPSGSGKTFILKYLDQSFSYSISSSSSSSVCLKPFYIDCSIFHTFPLAGQPERYLLNLLHEALSLASQSLLLLDNLHEIIQPTLQDRSSISLSLTAILLDFIDQIHSFSQPKVWIIATSSVNSQLPEKFLASYRFGTPIEIPLPNGSSRAEIALRCLRQGVTSDVWKQLCGDAEYESGIATLAATISRGSKGYSAVNLSSRIFSALELLLQSQQRLQLQRHGSPSTSQLSEFTDLLCYQIFTNALPILSSDFNLQSYFCDFSSAAAASSPPQQVYGYEPVVKEIIHKCLPWKMCQQLPKNLKIQMKPCRGVLLYGPSGCGKTAIATRIAFETRHEFKFLSVSCAEMIHKVVGESEKRLSKLFTAARAMAPCFLLLDNIEVMLGITPAASSTSSATGLSTRSRRREGHRTSHQAIDRLLSTLLMEMDGIRQLSSPLREIEETVVVIATSLCHPTELDSAIIRPGRLEEHIQILPPTESQARQILHGVQGASQTLSDQEIEKISHTMAGRTVADLVANVQEAQYREIRKQLASLPPFNQIEETISDKLSSLV